MDMSTDTTPDDTSAAEAIRRLTDRLAEAIEMAPTYSYVAGDVDKDLEVLVAINRRADDLAAELAEARELANTYSAALSMVEDCLADAAGDDTSINDIRQSLGLPARDDMLPAPGDTVGKR